MDYMKAATVNFKTDDATKAKAQAVAKQIGIPLSNLLNAYLYELANTGTVHFTALEPMTKKMEVLITEAEKEIAAGEVSEPFNTAEEAIAYLKSL
jgi:addiction module RelB/DinJ family antitoxin